MEIIQYSKCNISNDIIKYKFEKWVEFHTKHKIVNIDNIVNGIFLNIDNDNYSYYEETYDKYISYNYIYEKYDKNNQITYCIIYNKKLVGIMKNVEDDIKDLILSDDCNWYEIIKNIINFMNIKYDKFVINFDYIMEHHPIISNIIEKFNGTYINNLFNIDLPLTKIDYKKYIVDTYKSYIIPSKTYNYLYCDILQIKIIGYNDYYKNIKNIIFNYKSNIGIISKDIYVDCALSRLHSKVGYDKNKHLLSTYTIIMEKPLCFEDERYGDIYLDMYIIYKNIEYKVHNHESSYLKLNKLFKKDYNLNKNSYSINKNTSYIYKISTYKNICKCNYCKKELDSGLNDNKIYYHGNESRTLLYNIIDINKLKIINKDINHENYDYDNVKLELNIAQILVEFDLPLLFTNESNNTDIIINDITSNDITSNDITSNDNTNNTINSNITSFKYIYLIEKFDVNNKEYIYKFGKTNREYSKRIKEHGYEANVLLILDVNNCNVMEKKILNILSNTENIRKCSFGNEYFQCNDKEYIKSIILKNIYN